MQSSSFSAPFSLCVDAGVATLVIVAVDSDVGMGVGVDVGVSVSTVLALLSSLSSSMPLLSVLMSRLCFLPLLSCHDGSGVSAVVGLAVLLAVVVSRQKVK